MTLAPTNTHRLTDCFCELLAYVVAFRQEIQQKQTSYEETRADILKLLKNSANVVAEGYCTREDYEGARYAVCAWIDESVLASPWVFKGRWRPELLQRLYYQSADAGEKFFEHLKNLEPHQQGIREVYYLCLSLGFKGRYCDPDDGYALEQIKDRHLKLLFNSVSEVPSLGSSEKNLLFPEGYLQTPILAGLSKVGRSWGWMASVGGPLLIFIVLFLIYRFTLYHMGENILKAVRS